MTELKTTRPKSEIIEMIKVTTGCSEYTARRCAERIFGADFDSDGALK